MQRILQKLTYTALLSLLGTALTSSVYAASADDFQKELTEKVAAAQKSNQMVVKGKDDWLFFTPELQNLIAGQFWGPNAAEASNITNQDDADPLPAILDFKEQLDSKNIELLIVPIPAKAAIYPEKISDAISNTGTPPRLDPQHRAFYEELAKNGVKVMDLTPLFLQLSEDGNDRLYCKQDTHWSSVACELASKAIGAEIRKLDWYESVPKRKFGVQDQTITLTGDLWKMLNELLLAKEELPLKVVKEKIGEDWQPIEPWRESPVVLLGDSHCLVFHGGGDMHAQSAGLPDHLALQLGFPVDLVAVRGSGATPSRINLLRRRDDMEGKKLVVWCFSVREFTEGQGWKKVPVIR